MIRIFSKLRQSLLAQNRLTRYLLYAMGEIVLVVIGILIALQINTYSENQKLRKKEVILLEEMQQNLRLDLEDINFNLNGNALRIRANNAVLEMISGTNLHADSADFFFGNFFGNFQLSENTTAWENLKSIGVDIISDNELRKSISYLYSNRYVYLENLEKDLDDRFHWDHFYPQLLEHIDVDELWESAKPADLQKLAADRKFKEVVKMNLKWRHYMQNQYSEVRELIIALNQQIDEHLNQLETNE